MKSLGLLTIAVVAAGCASQPVADTNTPTEPQTGWNLEQTAEDTGDDVPASTMTVERLDESLARYAQVQREGPAWTFMVDGTEVLVVCDPGADRMRVVAPVSRLDAIEPAQVFVMLEANFHTALDARYATSNGVIYAAFIHPLSSLSDAELHSGISQVVSLSKTFGTTYTSGEMFFRK